MVDNCLLHGRVTGKAMSGAMAQPSEPLHIQRPLVRTGGVDSFPPPQIIWKQVGRSNLVDSGPNGQHHQEPLELDNEEEVELFREKFARTETHLPHL